jgi:DNA-binding transcriptional ArsR family regulator
MAPKSYLVKEIDGQLYYDKVHLLKNASALKLIDHEIRLKILKMLGREPMYPAQIAKALNLHEQKVYYHIKQLINADVLEITERKEIRGTTAKKFRPKDLNFALSLTFHGKSIRNLSDELREPKLEMFLKDFIVNDRLNAKIVVGSPDPHGPYKARARDGHYAIDLALFLGSVCTPSAEFSTKLDVDIDLKKSEDNLIIVGGPVTNLTMAKANEFLPVKFSEAKPWGISGKKTHTEDNIGLIANISNPYNPHFRILALAGIRFSGTKAAVIAFTRFTSLILAHYSGQKEFSCIVQGFDLDGDGKVDSIELLE